jgi:hypothetical protein
MNKFKPGQIIVSLEQDSDIRVGGKYKVIKFGIRSKLTPHFGPFGDEVVVNFKDDVGDDRIRPASNYKLVESENVKLILERYEG